METMKIVVPVADDRDGVKTLKGWGEFFTEAELVEIVHRYCNTQDGAKKYRQKASEKNKAMKALLEAHGLMGEVTKAVEG